MANVPALVDQFGKELKRPELDKSVLTKEVAGPTLAGVRTPMTGYPGDGLNPYRLASILREADQGQPLRYLELAETIEERDLHYAGVLGTRKRSVAQIDISIDAAGDDARSVEQADMIREWLDRDELADELFDILDAIGKGYSFTEIIWNTSTGQWRPERLEFRDPRWFAFSRIDGSTPLLRTDEGDTPLPMFKFIAARIKAKSGLPVRSGIARIGLWAWMFKAFTQRDWAIFSQTYGQPVRVGKYGAGASNEDKDTLFRAVANIAGDMAAIIPDSMLIEFIQSPNVGASADLYERRSNWLDQQVSKAVLGQTATTDAIAGGHAVGQEHRQVQEDIERADAKALSAILNRDLIRPWIDLEYGPQDAYPRLRIARPENRDLAAISTALGTLVPLGLKVEMSAVRDLMGFEDPAPDAELLTAPAATSPSPLAGEGQGGGKDAAAGPIPASGRGRTPPSPGGAGERDRSALHAAQPASRPQDAIDLLAARAEDLAQPAADALIGRVRDLVATSGSLEEVRDGLLALAPDLPAADLASLLRQALVMAELLGRSEIGAEGS